MFSLIGVLNALIRTGAILYVFSRAKVLHDLDCVYLADFPVPSLFITCFGCTGFVYIEH